MQNSKPSKREAAQTSEIDVAIVGGGIAGLWTLSRLRSLGFSCVLVERHALGSKQTLSSQGMLHSGTKYALSNLSRLLSSMPDVWKACIGGTGAVDLKSATILTHCVHLWSSGILGSVAAWFAPAAMLSPCSQLSKSEYPSVFRAEQFKGAILKLEEMVVDVKSVMESLLARHIDVAYQCSQVEIFTNDDLIDHIVISDPVARPVAVKARAYIFAAGEGNEELASQLGISERFSQVRPLKMVMLRGIEQSLFGHCLAGAFRPLVTVTTHRASDGTLVWYLGGQISETAASIPDEQATIWAKSEMSAMFSWLEWPKIQWAVHTIKRAEPWQSDARLPEEPAIFRARKNGVFVWPTKMVLAPLLSERVVDWIGEIGVGPSLLPSPHLPFSHAEVGTYPWEQNKEWKNL